MWVFFFLFFFSLCPISCLHRSFSRLTVKFTSWAKLESSCQSKQCIVLIFYNNIEYCSHHEHFNDALFISTFSVYSFISSPERFFYLTPCCIFHMSIVCVYIQKQSRASAICANDKIADEEGKYFLIRSTAGEQVVALLADVIK